MKNIFVLIAFLCSALFINAQTTYPTGASGVVGRWDFSSNGSFSTLPDVSGNNNNGSAINITAAPGWRNHSYSSGKFDGVSSTSIVPHSANLTPSTFTIVALVNFDGFYSGTCNTSQFISKGQPYFISGNYGLGVGDNTFDGDCNIFSPNNQQMQMQANTQNNFPVAGNYVDTTNWFLMVVTFNNSQIEYYQVAMDPISKLSAISAISTVTPTGPLGTNTQDLSIGSHLNPLYRYWFNGKMDELVLFNRVLTNEEIYGIYDYLWGYPTSVSTNLTPELFQISNVDNKVVINTDMKNYDVKITAITGATIFTQKNCNESLNIDLSHFSKQLFLLEILADNKRLVKKL